MRKIAFLTQNRDQVHALVQVHPYRVLRYLQGKAHVDHTLDHHRGKDHPDLPYHVDHNPHNHHHNHPKNNKSQLFVYCFQLFIMILTYPSMRSRMYEGGGGWGG